jgi:hypothetical protein
MLLQNFIKTQAYQIFYSDCYTWVPTNSLNSYHPFPSYKRPLGQTLRMLFYVYTYHKGHSHHRSQRMFHEPQQTHPENHTFQQCLPALGTVSDSLCWEARSPFVVPAVGIVTTGLVILSRARFVVTV